MSLLEEAQAHVYRGPPCTISTLPDDVVEELAEAVAAIDGRTVSAKAIASALRDRGFDVGAHTINRHFRGDCRCESA